MGKHVGCLLFVCLFVCLLCRNSSGAEDNKNSNKWLRSAVASITSVIATTASSSSSSSSYYNVWYSSSVNTKEKSNSLVRHARYSAQSKMCQLSIFVLSSWLVLSIQRNKTPQKQHLSMVDWHLRIWSRVHVKILRSFIFVIWENLE